MSTYEPGPVEAKWQKKWEEAQLYDVDLKKAKDPFYNLIMYPYPSGAKLHVGHWYQYGVTDSYARYMRMKGKDVFFPMGFDAFGLPAENYAIKTGVHPADSTRENTETMQQQFKRMGAMYDWSKTINSSEPEYYRWTQWLFLEMFKNGIAYKKEANVNWCPSCQTVLANEQSQDGTCERCGTEVMQKPMNQWFWRITDYADRLVDHLDDLDWPEKTRTMQRNWIGRSEGCDVSWQVDGSEIVLDTFTTTVDTIYGVTFVVISPEHPQLLELVTDEYKKEVEQYCDNALKKSDIDRMAEGKEKTGVDTGAFVIHPFTGKKVPLWVADYVLMNYGTGVVMGVPAHDQRDMDFAKKYNFDIIQSIQSEDGETFVYDDVDKYNVKGTIIDSEDFTGMDILEGRKKITDTLAKQKKGTSKIQYKLRDWSIGRQRYWGSPIPIVYDPEGNPHPVPTEHLPWLIPTDADYKPKGKSPLATSKELFERTEKIFGKGWTPEVDTMDTFVCSSYYYLLFLMSDGYGIHAEKMTDNTKLIDPELEKKWMPVNLYIGGPEHACMHLIYARFIMMALKDFGHVSHEEPFTRLVHQGLITNQGAKMSKSKGNVVSPDEFVEQYGSDVFRMYLMFMGPYTEGGDWSDTGIKGVDRFVQRVWKLFEKENGEDGSDVIQKVHATIKKVTEDIEKMQFNTAISAMMELLNLLEKQEKISEETAKVFTILLAPLAPHIAEELWEKIGGTGFVLEQELPQYNEKLLVADVVTVVVQINGKVRAELSVAPDIAQEEILKQAKDHPDVQKYLDGQTIKKEIYIPGKIVSLVV